MHGVLPSETSEQSILRLIFNLEQVQCSFKLVQPAVTLRYLLLTESVSTTSHALATRYMLHYAERYLRKFL